MAQESETFASRRDPEKSREEPPWTVRKHLCWAGILLGMVLLSLPAKGVEGLRTTPLLIALLILAHAVAVATVQRDRVERVYRPLSVLICVGWIVSDLLIGDIKLWEIIGYTIIGVLVLAGSWILTRRARSDVAAPQSETP